MSIILSIMTFHDDDNNDDMMMVTIGSLSSDEGNGNEFNSLNFYKNGELSRNQISRSGVQVKKENGKFTAVRSRSPQNLECGHFTLLFCRGRQRNVSMLLIKPIVLRRCR